jgi:hypothetical protein
VASDAGSVDGSASNIAVVGRSESRDRVDAGLRDRKARRSRSRRKKTEKRCAEEAAGGVVPCGAVRAIFRRLLACMPMPGPLKWTRVHVPRGAAMHAAALLPFCMPTAIHVVISSN